MSDDLLAEYRASGLNTEYDYKYKGHYDIEQSKKKHRNSYTKIIVFLWSLSDSYHVQLGGFCQLYIHR